MKVVSLFAGVGGFDLGFEAAGFEIVACVEKDAQCRKLLAAKFPNAQIFDDVQTVGAHNLPPCDVVVGGFPCFVAGTMVLTINGYKAIESLRVGEQVLTHNGNWKKITSLMSRNNAPVRAIKAQGCPEIVTTDEHPFYVRKKSSVWDSVRRSNKRVFASPEWVDAVNLKDCHLGQVLPTTQRDTGHTEDFWWLVGRYLADGWRVNRKGRTSGRVIICCSMSKASDLGQRIQNAGFNSTKIKDRTAYKFHITRGDFYAFLEPFGHGASGKLIPGWVYEIPQPCAKALLFGYLSGDGNRVKGSETWNATTVSKALALGIALLAQKALGKVASVHFTPMSAKCEIEGREVNQKSFYTIRISDKNRSGFVEGNYGWKCLRSNVPCGTADVYNISVADDESYVADGAIVHNCQDLSVAGNRAGLAGGRSGLFYEMTRIADELRPDYIVWENVPGLLSSDGGADMLRVLAELHRIGYVGGWRTLDAQYFGVAQRRRRVFGAFSRRDIGAGGCAEILSLSEGLRGHPAPRREARQDASARVGERVAAGGVPSWKRRGGFGWSESRGVTPTLEAQGGSHQGGPDNLPLVPINHGAPGSLARENSTGEGIRQDYETTTLVVDSPSTFMASDYATGTFEECETARPLTTSADRSRAAPVVAFDARGNGGQEVTPTVTGDHNNRVTDYTKNRVVRDPERPVTAFGIVDGTGHEESGPTLRVPSITGGGHPASVAIAFPHNVPDDARVFGMSSDKTAAEDVMPTMTVPSPTGGGEAPIVALAFTQNTRDEVRLIGGDGASVGAQRANAGMKQTNYLAFTQNGSDEVRTIGGDGDQAACLNTSSTTKHRTFLAIQNATRGKSQNGIGIGGEESPMFTLDQASQHAVATPSLVRRLTPLECERLQGFPDGWTEGFADSTRYRMMGNAVCVKVSRWIALRLMKVMSR